MRAVRKVSLVKFQMYLKVDQLSEKFTHVYILRVSIFQQFRNHHAESSSNKLQSCCTLSDDMLSNGYPLH